jgi:predicted RNA polymerase sigma factor
VPSVRGDLLERAGLHEQAAAAFTEAATRTSNQSERALLQRRAADNQERAT